MAETFIHPESNPLLAAVLPNSRRDWRLNFMRGIAQDHARIKLENAGIGDLTDSSSGTAAADAAAVAVQAAVFDATSAGGALRTDFNTQIGQIVNDLAVMCDHQNNVRARLGLPRMIWPEGTITTAGTIPAVTKTVTTTNGATSLDYVEGVAVMTSARNNLATVLVGLNEIAAALGEPALTEATLGTADRLTHTLVVLPSAAASATGASSVSKAAADIWFTAMAANIATMALQWNLMFNQGALADLTTAITGDTISNTLAAMTLPVSFVTAGTDCAPKAGFDTAIDLIGNNVADLSLRADLLLARYNLLPLLDYTAVDGTANTALEDHLHNLTEVTGTTVCVEDATGIARCTAIRNAIASLAEKVRLLAPYFGAIPLTDSTGGTASSTIGIIGTATATGVSGATGGNESLEGTVVDAFLLACKNAEASIYSKLNEFTGTESGSGFVTKPLHVVAGLETH